MEEQRQQPDGDRAEIVGDDPAIGARPTRSSIRLFAWCGSAFPMPSKRRRFSVTR
jgi:hypothetical protein